MTRRFRMSFGLRHVEFPNQYVKVCQKAGDRHYRHSIGSGAHGDMEANLIRCSRLQLQLSNQLLAERLGGAIRYKNFLHPEKTRTHKRSFMKSSLLVLVLKINLRDEVGTDFQQFGSSTPTMRG